MAIPVLVADTELSDDGHPVELVDVRRVLSEVDIGRRDAGARVAAESRADVPVQGLGRGVRRVAPRPSAVAFGSEAQRIRSRIMPPTGQSYPHPHSGVADSPAL